MAHEATQEMGLGNGDGMTEELGEMAGMVPADGRLIEGSPPAGRMGLPVAQPNDLDATGETPVESGRKRNPRYVVLRQVPPASASSVTGDESGGTPRLLEEQLSVVEDALFDGRRVWIELSDEPAAASSRREAIKGLVADASVMPDGLRSEPYVTVLEDAWVPMKRKVKTERVTVEEWE